MWTGLFQLGALGTRARSVNVRHPMEIVLIRHAQPNWAPERIATNDPDLTELGRRQAVLLGQRAKAWSPVNGLWVSPMRRAAETAAPVADALGVVPKVCDWLQEINNPREWEGSPVEIIDEILEKGRLRPIDEMWDGLPGGESFRTFHKRVAEGLEGALSELGVVRMEPGHPHLWKVEDDSQHFVIVAHGGTNAVILGVLLGLEPTPWEWERFAMGHTAIAHLRTEEIAEGRAFSLRSFADGFHLPEDLRSE